MGDQTSEQRICPIQHRREPDRKRGSAPGTVLCAGCVYDVERQLQTLSTFDVDATVAVVEQALARSLGGPVSGSRVPPLVISVILSQLKIDAADKLVAWLDEAIEKQKLAVRQVNPAPGNLRRYAEQLTVHVGWLVAQDAAAVFAEEVFDLGRRAWALLHPDGGRKFTQRDMRCVEGVQDEAGEVKRCEGSMWAYLPPPDPYKPEFGPELVCDGCGHFEPSWEWLRYGRRVLAASSREKASAA